MKRVEVKILKGKKWQIEEDLVLKEGKVYMSKDKELRVEMTQLHHNISVAEHRESGRQ